LLAYGELQPEPLLGITVLTPAEQLADDLWGLKVQEVTLGQAGDLAGIQAGDYIIAAAGESMYSSQDLLRVRQDCHLGDLLSVTLWRNGEIIEVTLELNDAVEEEEDTAPWYAQ
jgi:serine protease Do